MAEPAAGLEGLFEGQLARGIGLRSAAQLEFEFQRSEGGPFEFPFDIETDAGTLGRMLAQMELVGIALIKAWRKGVTAFQIEEMREDLKDAAGSGGRG